MDTNSNPAMSQVFLVIDKEIVLECQSQNGPDPLLTLMSSYFTFNLSYHRDQANMFRFIEEHVLGKAPKRKTYRNIETSLLKKSDKVEH